MALETAGARLLAGDARHDRIGRLADTARRAGVAIRCVAANLEAAPLRAGSLDAVLVDAPCSATGTMRRHPDARWRLESTIFPRAAARQARLLAAAAPLVRPGGLLIYATCSLEPEENESVVESFLTQHPDYHRAPSANSAVPAATCLARTARKSSKTVAPPTAAISRYHIGWRVIRITTTAAHAAIPNSRPRRQRKSVRNDSVMVQMTIRTAKTSKGSLSSWVV